VRCALDVLPVPQSFLAPSSLSDGTPEKTYLNPRAPTHIINGAGGQLEGLTPMPEVIKDTTAKIYNEDWGYGALSASIRLQTMRFSFPFATLGLSILVLSV